MKLRRRPANRIAMQGSIGARAGQFMQRSSRPGAAQSPIGVRTAQYKERSSRSRAGQARARQIMARARATQYRPQARSAFAERPVPFTRAQMETIRGYVGKAWEASRSMQKYIGDKHLVWDASVLAARLRVPKEKFEEAIKDAIDKYGDDGLKIIHKQLEEIAKITPRLGLDYAKVAEMLNQRGIESTHAQLMQQLEQARQMGLVG